MGKKSITCNNLSSAKFAILIFDFRLVLLLKDLKSRDGLVPLVNVVVAVTLPDVPEEAKVAEPIVVELNIKKLEP